MRQLEEKRFLLQKAADFCHQQEWEKADLRRKRKREEADLLHETEMLEDLHELQAATVERQVLPEKLENGGFSSGGDDNEDALRPPKQGTPKSKVLCDTINLTPIRKSDPVISYPKEEQKAVPKLSIPKPFDQGTKIATVKAKQSSEFQDSSQRTSIAESATVVASMMKDVMSKPTLELFKFDGNPTSYSRFISVFESTVEATENDDRRKLL